MINNISGPDGERIKEQGSWRVQFMLEAYRQGVAGAVYDETLILTQPWGFDLETLSKPKSICGKVKWTVLSQPNRVNSWENISPTVL